MPFNFGTSLNSGYWSAKGLVPNIIGKYSSAGIIFCTAILLSNFAAPLTLKAYPAVQ